MKRGITGVIVGCSAKKSLTAAPADCFYEGKLARAGVAFADANGLPLAFLSAEYGLVPRDQILRPYENRLRRDDKTSLIQRLENSGRLDYLGDTPFIVAGSEYAPCLMGLYPNMYSLSTWSGLPGSSALYNLIQSKTLDDLIAAELKYRLSRKALRGCQLLGTPTARIRSRPGRGVTKLVWDTTEMLLDSPVSMVRYKLFKAGLHDATIRIQYQKFHEFYNLPLCFGA